MSNASKLFDQMHYGVSTLAAVLYAMGWALMNQVHAQDANQAMLPAVVVSASRTMPEQVTLEPVVVSAVRERPANYTMLEPVVVLAVRDAAALAQRESPSPVVSKKIVEFSAETGRTTNAKDLAMRARHWFTSLVK